MDKAEARTITEQIMQLEPQHQANQLAIEIMKIINIPLTTIDLFKKNSILRTHFQVLDNPVSVPNNGDEEYVTEQLNQANPDAGGFIVYHVISIPSTYSLFGSQVVGSKAYYLYLPKNLHQYIHSKSKHPEVTATSVEEFIESKLKEAQEGQLFSHVLTESLTTNEGSGSTIINVTNIKFS
jgi:hypothetical protein